jgi:hypothetical protein
VAILCDGPGRRARAPPHAPTGYWLAQGWLLERAGWRVARLPWYEWDALACGGGNGSGKGGGGGGGAVTDPLDAVACVHQALAAQGIAL